jgi:hypothetical protein
MSVNNGRRGRAGTAARSPYGEDRVRDWRSRARWRPADSWLGRRRGDAPEDPGSRPRGALDLERAAQCFKSVGHPAQSRPVSPRRRIEPDAVVAYLEDDLAVLPPEPDVDVRGARILRDVVESLEDAEVDAGLQASTEPTSAMNAPHERGMRIWVNWRRALSSSGDGR